MAEAPLDRRVIAAAAAAMLLLFGVVGVGILSVDAAPRAPRTARAPRAAPERVRAAAPAPVAPRPVSTPAPEPEPGPEDEDEPPDARPAHLSGRIAGGGELRVRACGHLTFPDPDGRWSVDVEPGACEIVAIRQDGQFPMLSEPVALELRPGDDRVVDLALPRHRAAGLGLAIRPSDEGIRVADAIAGGAAAEAGLTRGDLIVEIDGEPTAGMPIEEFQRWGIGQAGTVVPLVVQHRDGTEETVRLDRRSLD